MKHHPPSTRRSLAVTGTLLLCATSARADDWPAWRGPNGTGVSNEKSAPLEWDATKNIAWRIPLPERGNSTPIVFGDKIFVTQSLEQEKRRTLMCFARRDGKPLWQAGVDSKPAEPTNSQNPHCSASPVTDGERVIALFGSAGLYCYDLDGHELWHRDLGAVDSWHGSGSSPIIYHDLCIVNFGPGNQSALVACNKQTGEIVWNVDPPKVPPPPNLGFIAFAVGARNAASQATQKTTADKIAAFGDASGAGEMSAAGGYAGSWSTPLVAHVRDHDELVVVHALAVVGYDPATGKELWRCNEMPQQVFTSPALSDGVLFATGHITQTGTYVAAIKLGGSGDVTATHRLWQTKLTKECVGSTMAVGDSLFLISDHGFAICLDAKTGEKRWEKRLAGSEAGTGSWSSPVLVDGKLYAVNQSSETFVLAASPEFKLLATNPTDGEITCASLAISNGQFFLRSYQSLWCIGAK
jgi:outer membrane protein assembly factor BamB